MDFATDKRSYSTMYSEEPRAGGRGSSKEKAIYLLGADRPQTHIAIHPRSEERGIPAFSRNSDFLSNGHRDPVGATVTEKQ
jgi:hypothetical protein